MLFKKINHLNNYPKQFNTEKFQYLDVGIENFFLPSTNKTIAEFRNTFKGNKTLKTHDYISIHSTGFFFNFFTIISCTLLKQVSCGQVKTHHLRQADAIKSMLTVCDKSNMNT